MAGKLLTHLRQQWIGVMALFVALSGGVAWATHPGGANTISSADIIDNTVRTDDIRDANLRTADIDTNAIISNKIADGEVLSADVRNDDLTGTDVADTNSLGSPEIGGLGGGDVTDGSLTGADVANNSLKGADVDESTLDIGVSARAYAVVGHGCFGTPGNCDFEQSKGISLVTRDAVGSYCVIAPGIDSSNVPAVVGINWNNTSSPQGNASVSTLELQGCGPSGEGFSVFTYTGPNVDVIDTEGNPRTVAGESEPSNVVSFTIVIP